MRSKKYSEIKSVDNEKPTESNAVAVGEVVRCFKLNLRSRPDPKAPILDVLNSEEKVEIDLTSNYEAYYKVKTKNGKIGYVMKTYISFIE